MRYEDLLNLLVDASRLLDEAMAADIMDVVRWNGERAEWQARYLAARQAEQTGGSHICHSDDLHPWACNGVPACEHCRVSAARTAERTGGRER